MTLENSTPSLPSDWKKLNYYELLKITPEASPEEIKKAYLNLKNALLVKLKQPGASSSLSFSEAEQFIARIDEAWRILSDPQKRKIYQARLFPEKRLINLRSYSRRSLTPLIIEPVHLRSNWLRRLKSWWQKFKKY